MRGKLDLGNHKLAGLFRNPAARSGRTPIRKPRGVVYSQIWRLVDGAVRDTFNTHPDYLTKVGQRKAAEAVTKRVTGSLYGYATRVAQGRSVQVVGAAATGNVSAPLTAHFIAWLGSKAMRLVMAVRTVASRWRVRRDTRHHKFPEARQ